MGRTISFGAKTPSSASVFITLSGFLLAYFEYRYHTPKLSPPSSGHHHRSSSAPLQLAHQSRAACPPPSSPSSTSSSPTSPSSSPTTLSTPTNASDVGSLSVCVTNVFESFSAGLLDMAYKLCADPRLRMAFAGNTNVCLSPRLAPRPDKLGATHH